MSQPAQQEPLVGGTFYVVLPGAELSTLDSLFSSHFAQQLARDLAKVTPPQLAFAL